MFIYIYKLLFILLFAFLGYIYPPFRDLSRIQSAIIGGGFALGLCLIVFKVKKSELKHIWSSLVGILSGLFVGFIMFQLLNLRSISLSSYFFFKALFLFGFPITGLFIGINKSKMFSPINIKEFFRGSSAFTDSFLLDTSAIIDGRIVAISNSGFLEGEMIITQFVLAELQLIADSNDPIKKVRGKRGLDVIDQLKKNKNISLTILNKNVPGIKEVDQKIILMAKDQNFKVITNDVNLSKIAKLQDVKVLNVNELAFALKPIVHPGEHLNVQISKAGKEKRQGIAYLDDGTMVIIDDAKTDIGKQMEIEVTSVLQSTSGKMIFGIKI